MSEPTWGDTVRVKSNADPEMRPGGLAAVCGIRQVETAEQERLFGCPVGTTLYLVEFGDGSELEVPGVWIEVVPDDSKE